MRNVFVHFILNDSTAKLSQFKVIKLLIKYSLLATELVPTLSEIFQIDPPGPDLWIFIVSKLITDFFDVACLLFSYYQILSWTM